jgi:hypothetical protein
MGGISIQYRGISTDGGEPPEFAAAFPVSPAKPCCNELFYLIRP